jgi:hypothetical protein
MSMIAGNDWKPAPSVMNKHGNSLDEFKAFETERD